MESTGGVCTQNSRPDSSNKAANWEGDYAADYYSAIDGDRWQSSNYSPLALMILARRSARRRARRFWSLGFS